VETPCATRAPHVGIGVHNHYKGVRWSNAHNWDNAARAVGKSTRGEGSHQFSSFIRFHR
jgi:hypothetical protein